MKKLLLALLLNFSCAPAFATQSVFVDASLGSCADLSPTNTGTGTCTVSNPTGFLNSEDYTFTATSTGPNATFTVTGSVTGSHVSVTSGSLQNIRTSNGLVKFKVNLSDGVTPYAIGDNFKVTGTGGTQIKKSNFDLLTLDQICSNGCDSASVLNLLTNTPIRLQDASGGQYVGLKAPAVVGSSYTITLPASAPSTSTFLGYDGADYVWTSSTTGFPISAADGSSSAPSYSFASSPGSGMSYISTNTIGFYTGQLQAAKMDGSQQWTFGTSSASTRTHSFVKDVNAGDTTNPVYVAIGNSGSSQGVTLLYYGNAAPTSGPEATWSFQPRNNANSSDYLASRVQQAKDSSANTSFVNLDTYDGSNLRNTFQTRTSGSKISIFDGVTYGTHSRFYSTSQVPRLTFGEGLISTTIDIDQAVTAGRIRICGSGSGAGGCIIAHDTSNASWPGGVVIQNEGIETSVFNSTGQAALGGTINSSYQSTAGSPTSARLSGTSQIGLLVDNITSTAATANAGGVAAKVRTAAGSYTTGLGITYNAQAAVKGSGNTITNLIHYFAGTITAGANNAVLSDSASFTGDYFIYSDNANPTFLSGNVVIGVAGKGIQIKTGSNARMGTCTLVAGTCTVSNTSITANTVVQLTHQSLAGIATFGGIGVSARTPGTSFVITSSSALDTSVIGWVLFEPAP